MELTIILGAVSPPGNTVAYGTTVEINGITVITCNGANGNTGWTEVMGLPYLQMYFVHIPVEVEVI